MTKSVVYNSDCLEAMRAMDDNAFDLAIVDPPYGIGMDGGSKYQRGKDGLCPQSIYKAFGDDNAPSVAYFHELRRVSCNQIIWGANHFISRIGADSPCWIVWDKENGDFTLADCELAWSSFKTAVRRLRFRWAGMLQGDMSNKESRIHPTQKPVALYKWLLQNYAKPGDTILDTHLGSGSSRIAAYDLGFDFTGYELDKDYFDAQERRFADHIAQPKLWEPASVPVKQNAMFAEAA